MSVRNPPSIVTRAAQSAQIRHTANVLRTLTRAHQVVSDSSSWTRGALARTILRTAVLPTSELAVAWSTSGALVLAASEVLGAFASRSERERLHDACMRALWSCLPDEHPRSPRHGLDIDGYNDYPGTEHADVVAWFERAIARAREWGVGSGV